MALGFFRRRQKLVIFLMVLLMVAFLVPTGIRGCFERSGINQPIGHVGKHKLTLGMKRAADMDLRLLHDWLGLGQFQPPRPGELAFFTFLQLPQDHFLSWVLLLQEAREMGIRVNEGQVSEFLIRSGLDPDGAAYRQLLASLSASGLTDRDLRRAIADYLMVVEAFQASTVQAWPSLPELRETFRNLNERIRLAMVVFPAEDFLKQVQEPSDQQVREAFDKYRSLVPDSPANRTQFGFGYRILDEVDVSYLFVNSELLARAVEPSEEEMLRYWERNRGHMTRQVAVPAPATTSAASQPATGLAATQASQPAQPSFKEVPIESYSEARPEILEILRDRQTGPRMTDLLRHAEEVIVGFGEGEDAYAKTAAAMIGSADALLARKVARLPFETASLRQVIDYLRSATAVRIIYPFGRQGDWFLDENVQIRIEPEWRGLSLGELLAKIGAAHNYPKLEWVTCWGFDSTIFPSAPVDLVPISSGRTGMVGLSKLAENELLGAATLTQEPQAGGQTLVSIVVSASPFQGPKPQQRPMIEVGGDFSPALYVSTGARKGRLLFRLLKAVPAHTPEVMSDEVRARVVEDLKIVEAVEKAKAAAEAMKSQLARGETLEALAERQKRKVIDSGLLARHSESFGQIVWTDVPEIGVNPDFIQKAFELVPPDPEPPHTGRPAGVIPLYRKRQAVLVQRTGYEPAVISEFDKGALDLSETLLRERQRRELTMWFAGPVIARRVGFVERAPGE